MKSINILSILADNMRRLRKIKHLTQEELAYRCGLHPYFIGLIERKTKTPSLKTLEKIAEALNISPAELLTQSNYEESLADAQSNEVIQVMKTLSSKKADALLTMIKFVVSEFIDIKQVSKLKVAEDNFNLITSEKKKKKY